MFEDSTNILDSYTSFSFSSKLPLCRLRITDLDCSNSKCGLLGLFRIPLSAYYSLGHFPKFGSKWKAVAIIRHTIFFSSFRSHCLTLLLVIEHEYNYLLFLVKFPNYLWQEGKMCSSSSFSWKQKLWMYFMSDNVHNLLGKTTIKHISYLEDLFIEF